MNNKFIRYILGFLLLALILAAFCLSKELLFFTSIFFIIITMIEYRKMFKTKNIYPHIALPEIIGSLCAYVFVFSNDISSHDLITPILLTGVTLSFIITVIRNKKPYILTSLSTIAAILLTFCGLYIIKLTYYFENKYNWILIISYFAAVLVGDFFASIIGPRIKGKLLAKEISPNKTVAGSITNLISSCLCCLTLTELIGFTVLQCLGLGIVISIFAQFGDLTMSSFKRDLEIKHSSSLFCNYGGILDRMDAFLFSAPAAYYYLFAITIVYV